MAKTILICEDNREVRGLMRHTLAAQGYAIAEAPTGTVAVDLARTTSPDLIILDVMLPDQSGLDVLARLRDEPALDKSPVLLVTGASRTFAGRSAEALGANGCLIKPFSGVELSSVVEELLSSESMS